MTMVSSSTSIFGRGWRPAAAPRGDWLRTEARKQKPSPAHLDVPPDQPLRRLYDTFNRTPIGLLSGGGATNLKFRVSHGSERSPDSGSARRELSNSGLASQVGTQKCDFTSNFGGGTTAGGHQSAPGSGQAGTSVLQKHYREPLYR
jgi:hypothetical protein